MSECQHCDHPNEGGWFYCRNCGDRAQPPKFTINSFMETIASNNDRTIDTAYDNDYYVGSLVVLPSAVWAAGTAQDGLAANIVVNSANDVQITFDDNLANGAGGVGSIVKLTAVVTGNTGAGGGAKLVWAVTGQMFTADPNGNGTAIFT